jgi:hypothetical protein
MSKLNQTREFAPKALSPQAFTLVELLFSTFILTIFLLALGSFFLQGNEAAAKGTWRTHTNARVRTAMKMLQIALDKTSYPSYTGPDAFDEIRPWDAGAADYDLNFSQTFSSTSVDPVTWEAGVQEGTILQFVTASPHQVSSDLSVEQAGVTTRYTLAFPLAADKAPHVVVDGNLGVSTALQTLVFTAEEGNYNYDPATTSFTAPTYSGNQVRITVPDVQRISFGVFQAHPNPEYLDDGTYNPADYPRITLRIILECNDPIDARLKIVHNLLHMIHTQVR